MLLTIAQIDEAFGLSAFISDLQVRPAAGAGAGAGDALR